MLKPNYRVSEFAAAISMVFFSTIAVMAAQGDAAQTPPSEDEPGVGAQHGDLEPFGGGPSELDILSRRADDPFPRIGNAQKREPVSVTLRALDKITARFTDIEAPMNKVVKFGTLEIVPRFCDKRPPEEFPEATAFLQIFDQGNKPQTVHSDGEEIVSGEDENGGDREVDVARAPHADTPRLNIELSELLDLDITGANIFHGWMFASSPALNPLEHAVYDVWVIDCKTAVTDS